MAYELGLWVGYYPLPGVLVITTVESFQNGYGNKLAVHLEQGKTWEAKKTLAFLRGLGFSKELNLIMRSWLKKQVHAFRIERIADLESMVFKFEPRVQFIPLCKN